MFILGTWACSLTMPCWRSWFSFSFEVWNQYFQVVSERSKEKFPCGVVSFIWKSSFFLLGWRCALDISCVVGVWVFTCLFWIFPFLVAWPALWHGGNSSFRSSIRRRFGPSFLCWDGHQVHPVYLSALALRVLEGKWFCGSQATWVSFARGRKGGRALGPFWLII